MLECMFASAVWWKNYALSNCAWKMMDCASCYACCLNLQIFSIIDCCLCSWAVCPGCVLIGLLVASSSPVEGQGRDNMVSERHGCNNGPLWAKNMQWKKEELPSLFSSEQMDSEKSSKCERSDHWRKWNSAVAEGLAKLTSAVADEWVKSSVWLLRKDSWS